MDLDSLKSAVVIEDPAEVMKLLEKKPGPAAAEVLDSGQLHITKSGSLIAKDGVPMTNTKRLKSLVAERGMPWKEEYKDRAVPYFASDERVDGHGDIVRQSWDFTEFGKNSPLQFSHEWWAPSIGRAVEWEVLQRKEADYEGPALYLLGLFATKDDYEWADTVFRLVKSRILPMGSVGFFAGKVINIEDEDERAELGLGRWGLIFEENHLLEFSPTAIPANDGAGVINNSLIMDAAKSGDIEPWDIHWFREMERRSILTRSEDVQQGEWLRVEEHLVSLARTIWPDEEFRLHKDLDVPVTLSNAPRSRMVSGSVSVPDTPDFGRVLDEVGRLTNQFGEFVSSTGQVLDDIRERVESMEAPNGEVPATPTEDTESDDPLLAAMERTVERLEELNP